MVMENKLGIFDEYELAQQEELITKKRALELFEKSLIYDLEVGTFKGLSQIHAYLFGDVYDFAGKVRSVNISKGGFRFASALYLEAVLESVEKMPQGTFDEIIAKYVEMNVAHPFREGNGRAMRLWLDSMLRSSLGKVIDWSRVDKQDYLLAMERSPIKDLEIKELLRSALTDAIDDRQVFMKGLDASYAYEGYRAYRTEDLV